MARVFNAGEGTLGSYRIMQVGDRRPHRHHSHPIGQFPAHRLSQDWAYLLGGAGDAFALPFWAIPRPSGELRLLGSIVLRGCGLIPGWAHCLLLGDDINVAEKDGSQPHKFLGVFAARSSF